MDEQASFETRSVLAPRRARVARIALLLPVIALVAIVWAGFSGARQGQATADVTQPIASVLVPGGSRPQHPAQALGLDVRRLDDIQPRGYGPDQVLAVTGWYVQTAITNCPPLAAIYRDGSLPNIRGDADSWAFCRRSGVLYASQPDAHVRRPSNVGEENRSNGGVSTIAATFVVGVIVPAELEVIGSNSTEVVVLGHFVDSRDSCEMGGCPRELVIDYLTWPPGA